MKLYHDTAEAGPNKTFFVSMLTRDIELQDAILDLLDNCVDGAQRCLSMHDAEFDEAMPYDGYFARLTMTPERFEVRDNCGGIPKKIAKERAFMMGRPTEGDTGIPTVGRYGIGMKRAIFKMGNAATVVSRHGDETFGVNITNAWMNAPNQWQLPMIVFNNPESFNPGTRIRIDDLRDEVSIRFDEKQDNFLSFFRDYVSKHYSIIIAKGFTVTINGQIVRPSPFKLFASSRDLQDKTEALTPYVLTTEAYGVKIEIYAGLFRNLPSEEELELEEDGARSSKEGSGWTIACNDRVVLYRDRTHITGWGTSGIPNWHNQFMAFGGIVLLSSDDVTKLPLTTTKRGIDASTRLYSVVLDYMREATKSFTSFTYKWKKAGDELKDDVFRRAEIVDLPAIRAIAATAQESSIRKFGGSIPARTHRPNLPLPQNANRMVRISYEKSRDEVRLVAEYLFEDAEAKPKEVGLSSFNRALKSALGSGQR